MSTEHDFMQGYYVAVIYRGSKPGTRALNLWKASIIWLNPDNTKEASGYECIADIERHGGHYRRADDNAALARCKQDFDAIAEEMTRQYRRTGVKYADLQAINSLAMAA